MTQKNKNILIHVGIVLFFLLVSCIYFAPILSGDALPQGDLQKYEGMAKAQKDYHNATGNYSTWAPSMFSGMPGYQITNSPQHSVFTFLGRLLFLDPFGRGNDIGVLFLYLIGFYIALIALGASPWLALLGSLAFSLGSYNIIIIEAGHITKARAMAMIAPILAGMILTFRRNYVWGGILFTFALGLQIALNHIQITFYTVLAALILGVVYLIYAIKDKAMKPFLLSACVLLVGCMLAFGGNLRHLLVNLEYSKATMRGGKEITVTPQDLDPNAKTPAETTTTSGLDINYAFSWSYGVGETYTLLVPGAMGGGSGEKVNEESAFYKNFHQNLAPLYWGDQPFTSGPVYFGAIIIFLFVFGLFVVKGPERWWLLLATMLAILMSWGRNAMGFNEWIFNHLPLYNKFRTPSMALVVANVTMVLMAVLSLKAVAETKDDKAARKSVNRSLYIASGITLGMLLLGMLLCSGFSFSGVADQQMAQQYGQQWNMILDVLQQDRMHLFKADSMRSLIFVVLAAGALWLFVNDKIKKAGILFAALTLLVVVDLWNVDTRYLSKDNFTEPNRIQLHPESYDLEIDQQAAQFGDIDYRVMNLATDTYNNSTPSAFHQQIGGYSAAKLRRYQDLIDFYINQSAVFDHYQKNLSEGRNDFDNYPVLDMLNCRYLVLPTQNGAQVLRRQSALGNAWFVPSVTLVDDANAEILALRDFNPKATAIVNRKFADCLTDQVLKPADSLALAASSITLVEDRPFNPSHRQYESRCAHDQVAVFSDIYYAPDWRAYIDGKPAQYFQADYVLRAMVIPAGNHTVEFRNEAPTMHKLDNYTLLISVVIVLITAGAIVLQVRSQKKERNEKNSAK